MITAAQLRQKFLDFFKSKGHAIIPGASLIPENDPSVLFTTAGMHPLVPYLLGEKHPLGQRLADAQKCLRTGDIEKVGDASHFTFFEMLGNWSLGEAASADGVGQNGYWKKEAIEWSFEFLTSASWLGIPKKNLAVSVFAGDEEAPRDEESAAIWRSLGLAEERIAYLSKKDNWWGLSDKSGPCGPDTEMFYWTGADAAPAVFDPADSRWVEIWNDVFMQYERQPDGGCQLLRQKNVDTGLGLERMLTVLNNKASAYETELFLPLIRRLEELSAKNYIEDKEVTRAMRVIADHLRAAVFILGDEKGVAPANLDQGYVLRRLIRRAVRFGRQLGVRDDFCSVLAEIIVENYGGTYVELKENRERILRELRLEEDKFSQTLSRGLKKIEVLARQIHRLENVLFQFSEGDIDDIDDRRFLQSLLKEEWLAAKDFLRRLLSAKETAEIKNLVAEFIGFFKISGRFIFNLYTEDGFPPEMIAEVMAAVEKPALAYATIVLPCELDWEGFREEFKKHQELSRSGLEQKFKGGLADQSRMTTNLHTATHLLLAALRELFGQEIYQRGSNITPERLRFDFNWPRKLTMEEIKKVEDLVNQKISEDRPVEMMEMPKAEALRFVKVSFNPAKYGEMVKVYKIGDFSVELCGGPHVRRTGELGRFRIVKEEASSAGVRRIRAVLE